MSISVIVTCYNYEKYVGAAIESALGAKNVSEILVVDDGSQDGSLDVIFKYQRFITIVNKKNGGQGSAFNKGFFGLNNNNNWILFLDADDLLNPTELGRFRFPDSNNTSKIHSRMQKIDGAGNFLGFEPHQRYSLSSGDCIKEVLENRFVTVPTSGNIFSRSFLEKVLPMPEASFRISADNYLNLLAPFYGNIFCTTKTFAYYRVHGSNNYAGKQRRSAKNVSRQMEIIKTRAQTVLGEAKNLDLKFRPCRLLTFRGMSFIWAQNRRGEDIVSDTIFSEVTLADMFSEIFSQFRLHPILGCQRLLQLFFLIFLVEFSDREKSIEDVLSNKILSFLKLW